jgi:DnaJ like chaperone protein
MRASIARSQSGVAPTRETALLLSRKSRYCWRMAEETILDTLDYPRQGAVKRLLSRIARRIKAYRILRRRSRAQSTAFTSAFVVLAAKMAAADGVAVSAEAAAFEQFLEVPEPDCARIRSLYDQATQDVTGYEIYADRVGEMLKHDPDTKRRVFECLMYIACADGILHPAEDHFLKTVACRFSYSDSEFRSIRAMFVHDPDSPYAILDLPPDASEAEIRTRYRKLVRESHPDRLIAEGAPTAVIKAATAKLAHINAAYEEIAKERGFGGRS